MKRAMLILALAQVCLTGLASEGHLAWDASATPGVTNYVVYAHTNALTLTNYTARISVGTNLTATASDLLPGQWWFGVTAMKDGIQSDFSNILIVQAPAAPGNMRTVVLQYSATITNGFVDVGFFKLRIP